MNLLSTAERLAAIDRSAIVFDAARCLHSHDKFSDCAACLDICPVEAIRPGKPPRLESAVCASCLTCLPLCPSGAFSADDSLADLLNCAARVESGALELVCQAHPQTGTGLSAETTGLRVRGCLAGLGSGAYLALTALGVDQINLRLDACEDCEWKSLRERIAAQVGEAKILLSAWGKENSVQLVDALDDAVGRPLWDAKNPPMTRRDLFMTLSRQGQLALARAMEKHPSPAGKGVGRNRTRMIHAVAHLGELQHGEISLAGMDFAALTVNETCSACGACARICPTAALTFAADEKNFRFDLRFSSKECIACGACLHACSENAISVDHAPLAGQVWGQKEARTLIAGDLTRCDRCNILFAARSDIRLCPACEYRRQNPFGSRLPSGFMLPKRNET